MPKPPGAMGAETQTKNLNRIVLRNSAQIKSLLRASQQPKATPALPKHLDELIDQPWTSENSQRVDLWLWYVQQEFETTGGSV